MSHILLVDDDEMFLEAVKARLTAHGHDVVGALDAVQAIRFARETVPNLLILDVNLPAGDGFTVLERIRDLPELEQTPVIYVTGDRSSRISFGANEVGAAGVLYKPFETDALLDLVDRALGDGRPEQTRALADLQQAADAFAKQRKSA